MKRWSILLAVVLVAAAVSASAQTQISLGGSSSGQSITFTTPGGSQPIAMGFSGACSVPGVGGSSTCLSGAGTLQNPPSSNVAGNYYMWMTGGGPSLRQSAPGSYSVNMNGSTFNYLWSAANGTVAGTIALTGASQVSGYPQVFFVGKLSITSATGAYSSMFAGSGNNIDVTFYLNAGNMSLDALWANGGSASGYLSSGELVPVVPEPASMVLLGSGLLAAGSMFRLRRRK
jgi:hypothetical protein